MCPEIKAPPGEVLPSEIDDLENFDETPIQTINVDFNPKHDAVQDDEHFLLYIFSWRINGKKHFKYGTTERFHEGEDRGKYARDLFWKRLQNYKDTSLPNRKLEGLYVLPRKYDGIEWSDTQVGNKYFKGLLGIPESNTVKTRECLINTTITELEDTLYEQFGGEKKISIYDPSEGGYHDYQDYVAEEIFEKVKTRVENGNLEALDIMAYLAPRFGKCRTFLRTVMDLWEEYGYGAFYISPYWLSVHNGFEEAIEKYEEFEDLVFVDTRPDPTMKSKWKDQFEWAYKTEGKFPVVALSIVKGEAAKNDLMPLSYVPLDERIILIDEADYGAHTDDSTDMIEWLETQEHGSRSWEGSDKDSVQLNIYTTGSGKEKLSKYEKNWDMVFSIPYLELVRRMRNGNESLDHIVDPTFVGWNAGRTLKDALEETFPEEQIPSFYQLAKKPEENEDIWGKLFKLVYSEHPDEDGVMPATGMNITKQAIKHISNFNKVKDGLGVMAKMPSVRKQELQSIKDIAEEVLDDWAVMMLCGQIKDDEGNVIHEGTTNAEAEDDVENFLENEYDRDEHERGVLILTMGMGFRSFTVPDISVVANFNDGGTASSIVQAASRAFSPGEIEYLVEGTKDKTHAIFADYGFDQSKEKHAIEKYMARNTFAERDSDRSDGESLSETNRRIYPPGRVWKFMGEHQDDFGKMEQTELLSKIQETDEFSSRAKHNTNLASLDRSASRMEAFQKAKSTDISVEIDGKTNFRPGSSGSGGGYGSGDSDIDKDEVAKTAAFLRAMGFLIPAYAGREDNIFEAMDVISNDEDLRQEWIDLCDVTPEEFKENFLLPDEEGEVLLPVDEISTVYQTRDDSTFGAALRGVLGANNLYEIPADMAQEAVSSLSKEILINDNGVAVFDIASPKVIKMLRERGAKNIVVFTRLHVTKNQIKSELPEANVKVIEVDDNQSAREAYEQKINNLPMKFDAVVGNPPYQEYNDGYGKSASAIYPDFVRLGEEIAKETCFIIPSRWFAGGKDLKTFRRWVMNRNDIVSIESRTGEDDPFDQVNIDGGVCILYTSQVKDSDKTVFNGKKIDLDKYDILAENQDCYPIVDKVLEHGDSFLNGEIYNARGNVSTKGEVENMHESRNSEDDIPCYASQSKGLKNYVDPKKVEEVAQNSVNTQKLEKEWKVITPRAYGSKNHGFGQVLVLRPNEICTATYMEFMVSSAREAISLKSYLKTDFANYLLKQRKNDRNMSGHKLRWIPVPPLDRIWTDKELQNENLYKLSSDEWEQIKKYNNKDE